MLKAFDSVNTIYQNVSTAVVSGISQGICFFKPNVDEPSTDGLEALEFALNTNEDEREKKRVAEIQKRLAEQTQRLAEELAPIEKDLFKNYLNPVVKIGSLSFSYKNSRILAAHHIKRANAVKNALLAYGVNLESKIKLINNQIALLTKQNPTDTNLPDIDEDWLTKITNPDPSPKEPGAFLIELLRLKRAYSQLLSDRLSLSPSLLPTP